MFIEYYSRIQNSIHSKVISLINHSEFVKELMQYLEFLYSDKGNISRIFDVCKAFYQIEKMWSPVLVLNLNVESWQKPFVKFCGYVNYWKKLGSQIRCLLSCMGRVDYICNKLGMINIYAPT